MSITQNKKDFMHKDVMELLSKLNSDSSPEFGLMTAQHMVEHLSWTLKSCTKRVGEVEKPPTKGQVGFQKFIERGAIFQYRPSDKTKEDLPDLKLKDLKSAIEQVKVAIERFYAHYEANPTFKCYNKFFGELDFDQLELFNYNHYRYHLGQFGLLEK